MATRTWLGTGGTPGAWNVAANWVEGAVPVAADNVYFVDGSQSVNSGLAAAVGTRLIVGPGYSGDIGTSSTSLAITLSDVAVFGGPGAMFVDFGAGAQNVIVRSSGQRLISLKGSAGEVLLRRGKVAWDSGTITRLLVEYLNNRDTDVALTLNTPTVTAAVQLGGTVSLDAAGTLTKWEMLAGVLAAEEGTLTAIYEWGGICNWNTAITLVTAIIYGGTFDARGDLRAKTITNIEAHAAAGVYLDTGSKNITLTNGLKRIGGVQEFEAERFINYV